MKRYTERVRKGLSAIEANMEAYAADKQDEGDKDGAAEVRAALAWIAELEREAKSKKNLLTRVNN